jgi:4-amino-4-deoxy-L-arabinose transferase-like glycosyltransferase
VLLSRRRVGETARKFRIVRSDPSGYRKGMNAENSSRPPTVWLISKHRDLLLLVVIIALGASLRMTGLFHALGTHPDERHMVQVTTSLQANMMNPRSFAYGSFSFYAAWAFAQILKPFWREATSYDGLFIAGRVFCLLMGTLAIALVYHLSILLYRKSVVGLIAAFFLAVNVLHLQLSRFFTSDVTLTTLALIAIIALVRAHERGDLRSHLIFGACAGLATATKISSAFLFVPLAAVVSFSVLREWLPHNNWRRPLRALGIVLGGVLLMLLALKLTYWKGWPKMLGYRIVEQAFIIPLAVPFLAAIALLLRSNSRALSYLFASLSLGILVFVVAEPYAVLDFQTFQQHTREQTNMVRGYWRPPYTIQYAHTVPYLYHLQQMFWYTVGWPLFILSILGVIVTTVKLVLESIDRVLRREFLSQPISSDFIPLVFLAVFFLATGYFQVKFPRYLLPLYPLMFIFGASLLSHLDAVGRRRSR